MENAQKLVVFVILWIATLRSYYFFSIGASVDHIALVAIALHVLSSNIKRIGIPRDYCSLLAAVAICTVFGLGLTLASTYLVRLDAPVAILVYAILGGFWLARTHGIADKDLITAIKFVIVLHSIFLLIQAAAFFVFGSTVDFLQPITGEESRNIGGLDPFGLGTFRPSGLFNEPGTFSTFMLPLIAIVLVFNQYRFDTATWIGSLACVASLSFQGIGMVLIILIMVAIKSTSKITRFVVAPVLIGGLLLALNLYVMDRFFGISQADASLDDRLAAFDTVVLNWSGFGFIDPPFGMTGITGVSYWWLYVGPSAALVLAWYLMKMLDKPRTFLPLAFLLLSKITATAPLYWLVIALTLRILGREETATKQVPVLA